MTDHPITPSVELINQWHKKACKDPYNGGQFIMAPVLKDLATQAARWGADQQLEACDDYVAEHTDWPTGFLTSAMRPKPPSLKEQALAILNDCSDCLDGSHENIIRRALEELPND